MSIKSASHKAFEKYFAPEASAFDLGFCRLIFFTVCAIYFLPQDFVRYVEIPEVMWDRVWLHQVIPVPMQWSATFLFCTVIWKTSLVLSAIGLCTRPAMVFAFLGALVFARLQADVNCFYRVGSVGVIVMGIFSFSDAHLGFSIDSWIRQKRASNFSPPAISRNYGWPMRMALFCMLSAFLNAAMAKWQNSGHRFFSTNQVYDYILLSNRLYDYNLHPYKQSFNRYLLAHPFLVQCLAAYSLGIESIAILAFVYIRSAPYIYAGLALMQIGIILTMYIDTFNLFLPVYLFAVPWEDLWARIMNARRRTRGT